MTEYGDGRQGDSSQRPCTFPARRSTVGRMAVDLLVFGPHPDDIEIGLGATVARHTAAGHAVGLCDLTRAELSSNGSPEQREKEAQAAADVLGGSWGVDMSWTVGGS